MATFSMQLRAARDIEEGEEIFTTFTTDILQPAVERAKDLVPYGIECTCRACLDPTKSDPIRAAVRVGSKHALYTSYAEIDAAVRTLTRIEQEELHASAAYRQTLHELFSAYLYLHDEKTALMYGEKLWLAHLAAGEPLDEVFRNAEAMKKSPQWITGKLASRMGSPAHLMFKFASS